MIIKSEVLQLKKWKAYADWRLLFFLILFLNVKMAVKIPAVIILYLFQFDLNFGFRFKNSRLPLFYLLMLCIPFLSMLLNKSYLTPNYLVILLIGLFFWLLCILAVHQVKLSVERTDVETLHRTVLLFFLANAIASFANLAAIIGEIKEINPYLYQGQFQKYFIGTGDYIRGITFDTSTTNAVLNTFGVIYFITRKNILMLLVCMAALLLTGSNFTNIVVVFILALLFIFRSTRDQKSMIVICLLFLTVFMAKISPQNNHYVVETIKNIIHRNRITPVKPIKPEIPLLQRPDNLLTVEEKREKTATLYLDSLSRVIARNQKPRVIFHSAKSMLIADAGRILIPKADINTAPYQSKTSTPPEQLQLVNFIEKNKKALPVSAKPNYIPTLPGKAIGTQQTVNFLRQHPDKLLAGAGMGNFSSKLAFRATGLGITGGYPVKYTYINHDFEINHLDLYLNFFSKRAGFHSLTNSPFSVYDQLLAEYGLLGLLAFLIYYIGFYLKHYKILTYGLPILVFTLTVLFVDYWFEQLSILVFFELLLLLNIKENSIKTASYGK